MRTLSLLIGAITLALAPFATAQEMSKGEAPAFWNRLVHAGDQSNNWLLYGGDLGQKRFVPNDQINVDNVDDLELKWMFQTGVVGSFETTPIVDDGVMYITTPNGPEVFAVDVHTGRKIWHYQHKLGPTTLCCGPNNRGVAILGDSVYVTTLDAMLLSLDKKTGEVNWETQIADPEAGYSETLAPTVYKDKIVVGISGAEYGIRGFVDAYDAETGKRAWRSHLIPKPDEKNPDGTKGWFGTFRKTTHGGEDLNRDVEKEKKMVEQGKYTDTWKVGGASNWMTASVDPEREMVYVTTGNPSPDLYGEIRPGDNRWSDSLVAIDANTGEMEWAHQYLPHDVWDLDAASPPILAEVPGDKGKTQPVIIHGGKTGWTYVHDRETGDLMCRSENMIPHENLFALPTKEGTRMLPGANGGVEWSPGAYSPKTGMVYYLNLHQPMHYSVKEQEYQGGDLWLGGAFTAIPGAEQWGNITAVDVSNCEIAWQHKTEQPMIGGGLVTAGNVFFTGEGNGLFTALNAKTGKQLWEFQAGAGVNAAPMAFEVDGQLHIAVAAGGNFQLDYPRGDSVLVFALDED